MKRLSKIVSLIGLLVFLLSATVAIGLYWHFNIGECKEGCGEGMAYIMFLPAVIIAIVSGAIAILTHLTGKRLR